MPSKAEQSRDEANTVYPSAQHAVLGVRAKIGTLPLSKGDIFRLKAQGIERFSDCGERTIGALASQSVAGKLARSGIDPSNIDAVVLCTSSYWHLDQLTSFALSKFMCESGLMHCHLIQTSVQGCHNAITGLRSARNLLVAESLSMVLVITCDIARKDLDRLSTGPSILGDGAASVLSPTVPRAIT